MWRVGESSLVGKQGGSKSKLVGVKILGENLNALSIIQALPVSKETLNTSLQPVAFRQAYKLEPVFTYTAPSVIFSAPADVATPPPEADSDVFDYAAPGEGSNILSRVAPNAGQSVAHLYNKEFFELRYIDEFPEEWQEDLPTGYIQRAGKLEPANVKAAPDETKKFIKNIGGWEVLTGFVPETSIESYLVTEEEGGEVDISTFEVKDNVTFRKTFNPVTDIEEFDVKQFIEDDIESTLEVLPFQETKPATEKPKTIRENLTPLFSYPKIEALLPPKDGLVVFTRQVVA
ncbi:hypothetical protein ABW19_dt0207730 [Dactylella cylindrospora]|nr:hypothetical protein ABW19_dt0207730 [Dactylella cylindrospora]